MKDEYCIQGGTLNVLTQSIKRCTLITSEAWVTYGFRSYVIATLGVDDVLL